MERIYILEKVTKKTSDMSNKILVFALVTCLQSVLIKRNPSFVSASSEPPLVCPCEYRYDPVCGNDNVTYINKCILDCTNSVNPIQGFPVVKELHAGECDNLVCQKVNLPVCSLDGVTYSNECELAVENIRRIRQKKSIIYLAYRKECVGKPCGCTTIAAPVCGDDEVLYRNECVLDCACANYVKRGIPKISKKNNGACLDSCLCPDTKDPICGSDGKEYRNLCELTCTNKFLNSSKNEQIQVVDNSVCEGCYCTAEQDPVCGSDGRSYSNGCQLKCAAQRQNDTNLVAVSRGLCPSSYCNDVENPVCGTDLVTYRNECYLRYSNYIRSQYISIYHYGACLPQYDCNCNYCPYDYKPVCGNDGQTYWNMCWLLCYADCLKTAGYQGIWRTEEGACHMS